MSLVTFTAPSVVTAPSAVTTSLLRRGAARLADGAITAAVALALGAVIGFGAVWFAITMPAVYAYFVLSDTTGASPGKRLVGLQVVGPDHGTLRLGAAARREAFVLLGAVPVAGALLALAAWSTIAASVWRSPLGEGVHDRLAGGTRVVTSR